jgi:hypothetical protein
VNDNVLYHSSFFLVVSFLVCQRRPQSVTRHVISWVKSQNFSWAKRVLGHNIWWDKDRLACGVESGMAGWPSRSRDQGTSGVVAKEPAELF